jgi:elongation factor P
MMLRSSLLIIASLFAAGSAFAPAPALSLFSRSSSALAVALDTSDIKNGMTLELNDGEPYKVMSFSIMKQARGAAKTTIKFKNLIRGTTIENTYRSGEKFETAQIDKISHQFTYADEVSLDTFSRVILYLYILYYIIVSGVDD